MSVPLICHILIGCPGCGKSTFAAQLNQLHPTAKIISTDQIRTELFGNAGIQGNWLMIEKEVLKQMQKAMQAGQPVIYDATNAKKEWRIVLLKQLADISTKVCNQEVQWIGWHLQTPLELCKAWNKKRVRQVPDIVIEELFQELQDNPPHVSEGFFLINYVDISND
ncbi:MAG: AAA family ATPase [Coleofasciculaceae cyanobacterium]